MAASRLAVSLLTLGTAGHALVGLSGLKLPQQAFAGFELPAWITGLVCAIVLAASAMVLIGSRWRAAGWVVAGFWLAALVANLAKIEPATLTSWVPVAEAALLAAAGAAIALGHGGSGRRSAIGAIAAAMLLLFAAVHFRHADFVSGMIPSWLPARASWPYVTAATMAGAAASWALGYGRFGFIVVAAMFLLWIPIVHIGRIVEDPSSLFEWEFAAMAAALAGALLLAARRAEIERA